MVSPLVAALLPDAISALGRLLDRIIPDPEQKAKALLELKREENQQAIQEITLELQAMKMQTDVNLEEAKNSNIFVSGARPFIMWICGFAFAYHYLIQPFLAFAISNYIGKMAILPAIDMEVIGYTLTGMLGIGGTFRTVEKIRGVAK